MAAARHNRLMLATLHRCFEEWAAAFAFVCAPGCGHCCTQAVTLTSLEAEVIVSHLRDQGRLSWGRARTGAFGQPTAPLPVTANQFAAGHLAGQPPAEPELDHALLAAPCPFLARQRCAIYPVRPFACRCFASTSDCGREGVAEVPSLYLTVATVAQQLLEHLSRGRSWGGFQVILGEALGCGQDLPPEASRTCQPLAGFVVPPAEQKGVTEFLSRLTGQDVAGVPFGRRLAESMAPAGGSSPTGDNHAD